MQRRQFLLSAMAAAALAPGFVSLMPAKDIGEHWTAEGAPASIWRVVGEEIVCTGKPNGFLRSRKAYRNYVLRAEWRFKKEGWVARPEDEGWPNAGFFIHANETVKDFPRSLEVQGHYGEAGSLFGVHGGSIKGAKRGVIVKGNRPAFGEWERYEITSENGKITVRMNGELVNEGFDAQPAQGNICLQSEGWEVHYRNVEIKELGGGSANGPTNFQLACMTLPYAAFPMDRALDGIAKAGFKHVAWGLTHQNTPGRRDPMLPKDAPASEAKRLAARCRDKGLEPVMMFSDIYVAAPDSVKVHTRRIEQAAAAGLGFVLTFGDIKTGAEDLWVKNLKELGPIARKNNVLVTIKQHGGNTATGRDCQRIVQAVNDPGIKITYDAGNVLDYNNDDPIADIQTCWQDIRAFCIKDHRNTPKDEDCGPGWGEIDHYKLFKPVMKTGLTMPLAFENIFEPLVARPKEAAGVDAVARRSREFVETVLAGLRVAD